VETSEHPKGRQTAEAVCTNRFSVYTDHSLGFTESYTKYKKALVNDSHFAVSMP
jgi:hypothetical protein